MLKALVREEQGLSAVFAVAIGLVLLYFVVPSAALIAAAAPLLIVSVYVGNLKPSLWIYIQIIYNCVIKIAISDLGLPSMLNYVTDIITILAFIYALRAYRYSTKKTNFTVMVILIGLLLLSTAVSFIGNQYPGVWYLWGLRNSFRFYVFMFSCVMLLDRSDLDRIFDALYVLLQINFFVVLVQYFFFGITGDSLSGLFGTASGGNGTLNVLLCQVCLIAIVRYVTKKKSFWYMAIPVLECLMISGLNELKMFFPEIALIVACIVIFSKPSFRTVMLVLVTFAGAYVGIRVLYSLYPGFADFFDIDRVMQYGSSTEGYSGSGDLNRLTAIQTIAKKFLTTPFEFIFGIGMGNADYSTGYEFLTSDFYRIYGEMHYTWFSNAFVVLENGFAGLVCYLGVFVASFVAACNRNIKNIAANRSHLLIAQTSAILAIVYFFYDAVLRSEASGYLIYFFLAIPYVLYRTRKSSDLKIVRKEIEKNAYEKAPEV